MVRGKGNGSFQEHTMLEIDIVKILEQLGIDKESGLATLKKPDDHIAPMNLKPGLRD